MTFHMLVATCEFFNKDTIYGKRCYSVWDVFMGQSCVRSCLYNKNLKTVKSKNSKTLQT